MSERNYYVLCDDNCRFPGMTKEQILAAIAEATGVIPEGIDDAFITKIKESNHNAALTFWKGTEAEFNALGATAAAYRVAIDADGKAYFIKGNEFVSTISSEDESIAVTEQEDEQGRKTFDVAVKASVETITDQVNDTNIQVYTQGKLVHISGYVTISETTNVWLTFLTGLPAPATGGNDFGFAGTLSSPSTQRILRISADGELRVLGSDGSRIFIDMTYIAE